MSEIARTKTHPVMVGSVQVGGGAPVSVQSMCTTKTDNPDATLLQIKGLAEAGCEIIRVAIPDAKALDGFEEICKYSPLPVVADIHFDYKLALEALLLDGILRHDKFFVAEAHLVFGERHVVVIL